MYDTPEEVSEKRFCENLFDWLSNQKLKKNYIWRNIEIKHPQEIFFSYFI